MFHCLGCDKIFHDYEVDLDPFLCPHCNGDMLEDWALCECIECSTRSIMNPCDTCLECGGYVEEVGVN